MPYPNTNILNIVIPQTSASLQAGQAPFVERIISGSNLILQTDSTGTLIGSSDLNMTNITASNITASGYISASAIFDRGTLTVLGNSILSTVTASNISASAYTGSSANFTSLIATNLTASNISASGNISASTLVITGTTTFGNLVIGNITASNISASSITSSVLIPSASFLTFIGTGSSTYASSSTLGYFSSGNFNDFLIQSNNVPRVRIGGTTGNITFNNINGNNILILNTDTSSLYSGNVTIDSNGNMVLNGDLAVNGGDITTTAGTATLFNTNANNVNIGGGATSQVLLGNTIGIVKTAGNFQLGVNNIIQDASGNTGLTVSSSLTTVAGNLRVGGNNIQDSGGTTNLTLSSTKVTVPFTTQASDWTNGALTVAGGVGIGRNLHVSGSTFLYGDLTIYGSSSIVNISSSTVIIGDNRVVLNALSPFQRYAGIDVFDSGSVNVTSSFLWDGQADNWITVDQNQSASNVIIGPTASFGNAIPNLTVNRLTKAYEGNAITDSSLSDDGTTLRYTGNVISASSITASYGTVTYITGALVTYVTGSFNILQVSTGSSPGTGQVPSLPTNSGFVGQITVDNNFIYVYTGNIWKRVPISNWTP
jgi:hypothetical protein